MRRSHRFLTRVALGCASLALTACASQRSGIPALVAPAQTSSFAQSGTFHSCTDLLPGDHMRCFAEFRVPVAGQAPAHELRPDFTPEGYGPAQLQAAYALPASHGTGQIVGIVDAYNDPNIAADLGVYRKEFGLSPCGTSNNCFQKVTETGAKTGYPANNGSWGQEESLDVDVVSALCPHCHIILVEASSASVTDFEKAENEAVALGADVVSNSFGGSEYEAADPAYSHAGVVVVASSGDGGYAEGSQQPCSFAAVVCAGGTSLTEANNARGWNEVVWHDSGSGCSKLVAKPFWQTDKGCTERSQADVGFDSDPNTGVAVYDSYAYKGLEGWLIAGGTSVASPGIAAAYALAANGASLGKEAAHRIWSQAGKGINAVTSGNNGTCPAQWTYICEAGTGKDGVYSGPAGWGTPDGLFAF